MARSSGVFGYQDAFRSRHGYSSVGFKLYSDLTFTSLNVCLAGKAVKERTTKMLFVRKLTCSYLGSPTKSISQLPN